MKKFAQDHDPYYETRVLVLGASGFIGRWVARGLCKRGARVSLVVRNKQAADEIFFAYGIYGDVFEVDLENLEAVAQLLWRVGPSIIFNFAGYGMNREERDARAAFQINSHLVEVLAETARKTRNSEWRGQDILHVGSPLEYGTIGGSLSEDSIPQPTTLYGMSKLAGTESLARLCKTYNIKGLTARVFTVYGPGEPSRRLLPSLLRIEKTGSTLPLTSAEQKRDFVYVEDVSEGLLRLGIAQSAPGEVVNLATGRLTSVRVFAETVAKILGISDDKLNFGKLPPLPEEMHHSEVTTERLRRLIGWIPSTGIEEGIRKTIAGIPTPHSRLTVCQTPDG